MAKKENVAELSRKNFDEFVKKGVVMVDFFADWCMPCVMMAPVIDELSEKFSGKVKFGKVNVEDNREISQKFNVSSIPNLVFFKDGKVVEQIIGARSFDELEKGLKNLVK